MATLKAISVVIRNVCLFVVDIPYYLYIYWSSLLNFLATEIFRSEKKNLNGETILVTGAASGIGQKVVWELAELFPQAVFVLWDVDQKGLEVTRKGCRESGADFVHAFTVDLSVREEVIKTAALVREQVGVVTVLFNNAGIGDYTTFLETDADREEKTIKVNLLSYMWTIREFLPEMIARGEGHLICTCSALAFYRFSHLSSYVASKAGLRGFLDVLRLEMRRPPGNPRIKISTVYPGFVKTPIVQGVSWEPRYCTRVTVPMSVDYAVGKIVEGILKEKEEIIVPGNLKLQDLLYRFVPKDGVDAIERHIFRNMTVVPKVKCK